MLLSGVLLVLFLAGCWLYCLTDAALTPVEEFPGWQKRTWLVVIALTLIAGAIAWLVARRNWRARHWPSAATHVMIIDRDSSNIVWFSPWTPEMDADVTRSRHPAGRTARNGRPGRSGWIGPHGPDDDPEFLRELAARIHGNPGDLAD
jgi:hypothetical protein